MKAQGPRWACSSPSRLCPSLTAFLPPRGKAAGAALVVAPGGGFRELLFNAEGKQPGELPDVIPKDAPPAFLLVASDDEYGCDATTLELYTKLHAAGVPVEAHFLAQGKHAFNMGDRSS